MIQRKAFEAAGQRSAGFRVWTEDEITRFEAHWPVGTRERLAFCILLYTGLRRGDAARLGRQHVRNGVISMQMEKTGRELTIPLLPELAAVIEATKTSNLAFVGKTSGAPMSKGGFGPWLRRSCFGGWLPRPRPWAAQGRRDQGGEQRGDRGAA